MRGLCFWNIAQLWPVQTIQNAHIGKPTGATMYERFLKDGETNVSNLAVTVNKQVSASILAVPHSLQLYVTGGTATVQILHWAAGVAWEVLTLDDGAASVSLANGVPKSIHIAMPVERIAVKVTAITGTPLMTAKAVGVGL